jgi:hypothetical protein
VNSRTVAIEQVRALDGLIDGLAGILANAVNDGASVGFVLPLEANGTARWWRLMPALEDAARRDRRTLLAPDTISGSRTDRLYRLVEWKEGGTIPGYAAMPDGSLALTTSFYREFT